MDGTHIKANANLKKHVQKQIPVAAKRYQEQLAAEIEATQDSIKQEMTAREVDELSGSDWKVTWKLVKSRRFNSTAFIFNLAIVHLQSAAAAHEFCVRP